MTFERGFLTRPAVKSLLATWPSPEPVDAALDAIERMRVVARKARPQTKYLIQRKSDRFYFAAESHGIIGDVWIGNRSLAYRFDYATIAELQILKFPQSAALFDVVPVQG